jgi:D-glycero-D-manno-heptose 1,7-bisphosphate phosphatase
MWRRYEETGAQVQLAVYRNQDGYTRHNIQVDDEGRVVQYDRSRRAEGLAGVDIGFALLRRSALSFLPEENVSFESAMYPKFLAERQLYAFESDHRYYSVGGHERLELTRDFLKRRPTVFLDRDGVLNRKMPRGEYVRSWNDWTWLPGSREALAMLREGDYRVVVVSNQAGIARGVLSLDDLARIHDRMKMEAEEAGGRVDAIYVCPHGWDEGCECRKPKPGMLLDAQKNLSLDLSRTVFIGDDDRDEMAANAAGCPSLKVTPQQQLIDHARRIVGSVGSPEKAWQSAF